MFSWSSTARVGAPYHPESPSIETTPSVRQSHSYRETQADTAVTSETPKTWATRTASKLTSSDTFELNLPWSSWSYYDELQKALAKKYPAEANRPTIILTLKQGQSAPTKTVGIVGGLGPLADVHLLKQVMEELKNNPGNIELQIYSNPHPPRSFWALTSLSAWSYMWDLTQFLHRPHIDKFILGSNTAHIHYGTLNWVSSNRVFNSVKAVCSLLCKSSATRTLVLGTSAAYEDNLYPKVLQKKGLCVVTPSPSQQHQVQQAIDLIKSGNIEESRQNLLHLLPQLGNPPVSHILLACTELPLALDEQSIQDALGYHCEVFDTSKIFAKQIADLLKV